METIEKDIRRFLSVGSGDGSGDGYGSGSGSGDGYGSGSGDGSGSGFGYGSGSGSGSGSGFGSGDGSGSGFGSGDGSGDGYGSGYGSGDGYGSGYGSGDGIKSFNGKRVYMIDDTPTLIDAVHGNYACGHILKDDLTLTPCFLAKVGNYFAHGDTLKDARSAAQAKYDENRPLEERIDDFLKAYPSLDTEATCRELYNWHHVLTGSCDMGRRNFCEVHGIDMDKAYTVRYFLDVTANDYGKDIIRQVRERYK